jgi:hypothetical protein
MEPTNTMLKPISNGPIPPASPAKQLILRLAGELARLHDSQPSTLDLIDEARAYLSQTEPQTPSKSELFGLLMQSGGANRAVSIEWLEPFAQAILARWGK